jgi:predicted PurR-regulated permease PerM
VVLGAALFAFIQGYALLAPVLFSFLLILLITLALNPVVVWIQPWTRGRIGATLLVVVALLGIFGFAGWLFVGPLKSSFATFAERLPEYWERVQKPLIKAEKEAARAQERLEAEVTNEIARTEAPFDEPPPAPQPIEPVATEPATQTAPIRTGVFDLIKGVAGSFMSMAFNATQMVVVLLTVFFGVIFTLMNPRPVFRSLFSVVPEPHHDKALSIMRQIGIFVPRWAGATLLAMVIVGFLVFLLMWPIFGFVDALVLGLIAAVFEIVPFLGPILSVLPAMLLALGEGGMTPFWVVLAYIAVQALEGNVIVPIIMAREMELHPVAVIFSMLLCVVAFGVLGVLIAPPLVAVATILHQELYRKKSLPSITDDDLDRMARDVLREKPTPGR